MTTEEAKQAVRSRIPCTDYLEKSKGGMYCCPFCGSGHGQHGTGAVKYYPQTNTCCCFGKCGKKEFDIIDLYQQQNSLAFMDALRELAGSIGVTIDGTSTGSTQRRSAPAAEPAKASILVGKQVEAQQVNYENYYRDCMNNLAGSEAAQAYLTGRGISPETAIAYHVGFDAAADPASAPGAASDAYKPHPVPRIIIPSTNEFYVGRRITEGPYKKMNSKGGPAGIFNLQALWNEENKTVFVVEGGFDALSLLEVGAAAIALNSTNNYKLLLEVLKDKPTQATLLLALDNDDAGKKAQPELRDGLNRLNICNFAADIHGSYKDANEFLTGNKSAFVEAVRRVEAAQGVRPDNTADYVEIMMTGDIDRLREDSKRKTGFSNLDESAGALYSGLYVLAAISSLGKTTFALQMADQLAQAGNDVIFFSMEQSRLELVSKSIARKTWQDNPGQGVNSLAIRRGHLPENVIKAKNEYRAETGNRLSIVEGNFNCTIGYIGDYVRNYVRRTGVKPVVFIDYLQILQPAQEGQSKGSKKDEVDIAVTELKQISRELYLPVVVISSINRANYQTEFSFESLKESGGIEYTADVVWGLQLSCLDEPLFDEDKKIKAKRKRIEEAKAEDPRKVQLRCIKNRYGKGYKCNFEYYPARDLFVPAGIVATTAKAGKKF